MKLPCLFLLFGLLAVMVARAETPDPTEPGVWGKFPTATDDRFSNPKKPLYAGPDGWFNFGEVRAVLNNSSHTAFAYKGGFNSVTGGFAAVKDLQILFFDFDGDQRPAPGTYKIGAKGSLADKTVKVSFSDVGNQKIKEWSSKDGAGVLAVTLVNGFTYFSCRKVTLQPSGLSNEGDFKAAMTAGFEGALKGE